MRAHPGSQCAKCGVDVYGDELCGWCEVDALRVALAEAQRERDEARAQARAQLEAFSTLHDARAEAVKEQSDRIRQLVAALASAYRHHCVVECVSEYGCMCSDFDVVRTALGARPTGGDA